AHQPEGEPHHEHRRGRQQDRRRHPVTPICTTPVDTSTRPNPRDVSRPARAVGRPLGGGCHRARDTQPATRAPATSSAPAVSAPTTALVKAPRRRAANRTARTPTTKPNTAERNMIP